jgi:DNA-directed RNA polymerase specialized sigma24 family protein
MCPVEECGCSDIVRFGGDPGLAPEHLRDGLAAHLAGCPDCTSYVSQMATTREMLRRRPARTGVRTGAVPPADPPPIDAQSLRNTLLARAESLDPANAADLTQQALAVGLALQRKDSRPRGVGELTGILHALSDAQMRFDARITPAVDLTASARARADSLEGLDADADTPELFYPDLYPGDSGTDGWADGPGQWRTGTQVLGPEEAEEVDETNEVLDKAVGELPEPLAEVLGLVDIQGYPVGDAARALGLNEGAARAALARARNHVRGRLTEYLADGEPTKRGAPR